MALGTGLAQSPCASNPLLAAAFDALPTEQQVPCDDAHVVIVRKFTAFLESRPDLAADAEKRERARQAVAFVLDKTWPIYVNLDGHMGLFEAYAAKRWVRFLVSGMLAHEIVHANGEPSESAGLRAELQLDRRFQKEGKLPPEFNIRLLEEQVRQAEQAEGRRTGLP